MIRRERNTKGKFRQKIKKGGCWKAGNIGKERRGRKRGLGEKGGNQG